MSITNLQQNGHNRQFVIYTFDMSLFNADAFAELLMKAFESSRFKSFSALADEAKLSRSSVSALASAKKQSLTDKPSQPKRETVISLAKALNQDVNQFLSLAGYAPLNAEPSVSDVADEEFAALFYDSRNWSVEARNDALETAKDIFRRYQAREKLKREKDR